MLGLGHETALTEQDWQALESRTRLPASVRDGLQKHGHDGAMAGCQRRYVRLPLHKYAILIAGDVQHACYAKDISRLGIGFFAPLNLLPKTIVQLWLPHGKIVQLRVTRCRRLDANCYEIGTVFYCELSKLKKPR